MSLCISLVIPMSLLFYSNSRITDAKEALSAKIDLLRSDMNLMYERLSAKMAENHREAIAEIRAHETQHHR